MQVIPNRPRGLLDEGSRLEVIRDAVEIALVQHGVALGALGSNYQIAASLCDALYGARVRVTLALPWWRRAFFEPGPLELRIRRILTAIDIVPWVEEVLVDVVPALPPPSVTGPSQTDP